MKRETRKANRARLSPNEEAQYVREELERRRKLRVQQVREQERYIALRVRTEVQERKHKELQSLSADLREDWLQQRGEKIRSVEKLYQDSLRAVGQGHRSAKYNEPDKESLAQKREENEERAADRYRQALQMLASQRRSEEDQRSRHVRARKKALIEEKERAVKVASLPKPVPNPIESLEIQNVPAPKKTNVEHFSLTYRHTPETAVDRETGIEQPDAYEAAMLEAQRLDAVLMEGKRDKQDQLEKAQLRGDQALQKEKAIQDSARLLCVVEQLKQVDLQQRRRVVNRIPTQIFQPLYRHEELRAEQQRELEITFQDLYSAERELRGDFILQPLVEPLSAASATSHDEDLDVTLDPEATPCEETAASPELRGDFILQPLVEPLSSASDASNDEDLDVTLDPETTPCENELEGEETAAPASQFTVPLVNTGQSALRRLLDRIRSQRAPCNQPEPPALQEPAVQESSSIETGPLDNEEWEDVPSLGKETSDAGTDCEAETEAVSVSVRQTEEQIREVERRLTEVELLRLQQEQVDLLQQLEENRHSLELGLQETQQSKQKLQEEFQVDAFSPPSESSAAQRIFTYQQRLLKQNRLHKNRIEDARRQLEEYKKTLKLRYSAAPLMTSQTPAPAEETICPLATFAEGEHTSVCHHKTPPTEFKSLTEPELISQPSLHPGSSASSLRPAVPTRVAGKVLTSHSLIPERRLLHLPHPPRSILTTSPTRQPDVSATAKRSGDGEQPPAQTLHTISPNFNDPLVVKTPAMAAFSRQPATMPEQEKGAQGSELEREQMRKQRNDLQGLLGVENTKAAGSINGQFGQMDSASLSESHVQHPLPSRDLCGVQSCVRLKPPVSCPPRMLKVLWPEQHELSTIVEVETSAISLDTGAEVCLEGSTSCSESSMSSSVSVSLSTVGHQGPSTDSDILQSETCRASRLSWREILQLESADEDTFQPLSPEITYSNMEASSMTVHLPLESRLCPSVGDSTSDADPAVSEMLDFTDLALLSSSLNTPEHLRGDTQSHHALQMSLEQLLITNEAEQVMALYSVDSSLKQPPPRLYDQTSESVHSQLPANETRSEMSSSIQLFRDLPQQSFSTDGHSTSGPVVCPLFERILKLDCEKGILEESAISLASLSDITLQDDSAIKEED